MEIFHHFTELKARLNDMKPIERVAHYFWFLGPFIMLVERTPADLWISLVALSFLFRSFAKRDFCWLKLSWVKLGILFWAVCIVSALTSQMAAYSLGEAVAWVRFPLFAIAVFWWLGRQSIFLYTMIFLLGVAMILMGLILTTELLLLGQSGGRLSWPYGDLVPGNFLAKACQPAFVVLAALVFSGRARYSVPTTVMLVFTVFTSVATGERVNLLIRMCGGILAGLFWKPSKKILFTSFVVVGMSIGLLWNSFPTVRYRFFEYFFTQLPISSDSGYYQAMVPGLLAFVEKPLFGVGPANLRFLCPDIIEGFENAVCHPHPHNFYIQIAGEVGIFGLMTGLAFLGSIVWTCLRPALRDRSNVIVATMWIVPFGFFWPIASSADFFGQWNNIFMWSAVSVALAGARIGSQRPPTLKS